MEGSSNEGRKTSKELIAEEPRLLVHNADSFISHANGIWVNHVRDYACRQALLTTDRHTNRPEL
jgi:hypothetical protein